VPFRHSLRASLNQAEVKSSPHKMLLHDAILVSYYTRQVRSRGWCRLWQRVYLSPAVNRTMSSSSCLEAGDRRSASICCSWSAGWNRQQQHAEHKQQLHWKCPTARMAAAGPQRSGMLFCVLLSAYGTALLAAVVFCCCCWCR
jgi:hypothetical protein